MNDDIAKMKKNKLVAQRSINVIKLSKTVNENAAFTSFEARQIWLKMYPVDLSFLILRLDDIVAKNGE